MPVDSSSMDIVICICHSSDYLSEKFLVELLRVLKPDGQILLKTSKSAFDQAVMYYWSFIFNLVNIICLILYAVFADYFFPTKKAFGGRICWFADCPIDLSTTIRDSAVFYSK